MAGAPRRSRRRGAAPPPPPSPREFRQARARATYERLLRAAAELYGEQGYHATQTPDIAERAGLSVGGLYRYFRDKHQIFVELAHHGLEANRHEQDALLDAIEEDFAEGRGDLRAVAERLVDWTWRAAGRASPELLRTLVAMGYQDETVAALRAQYDRYDRERAARLIARIAPRSRIPHARAAATVLDVAVETLGLWAALHPGPESRGVKRATVDLVHRFLAAPEARGRRVGS